MAAKISYDLVMDDDLPFVEGTVRIGESEWEVFIFRKRDCVTAPVVEPQEWESGVKGVCVAFPREMALNKAAVEGVLGKFYSVREWCVVNGPDSMQLR